MFCETLKVKSNWLLPHCFCYSRHWVSVTMRLKGIHKCLLFCRTQHCSVPHHKHTYCVDFICINTESVFFPGPFVYFSWLLLGTSHRLSCHNCWQLRRQEWKDLGNKDTQQFNSVVKFLQCRETKNFVQAVTLIWRKPKRNDFPFSKVTFIHTEIKLHVQELWRQRSALHPGQTASQTVATKKTKNLRFPTAKVSHVMWSGRFARTLPWMKMFWSERRDKESSMRDAPLRVKKQ